MRVGYFDCASGASGDMILGALVGAGAGVEVLNEQIGKVLPARVALEARTVARAGFQGTKVDVVCRGRDEEHRHLRAILDLIGASDLDEPVKSNSARIFQRLAEAEARVHGCAPEEVHFHEVGAVDAIADIVGAAAGIRLLGIEEVYLSALALGTGYVQCAHGRLPVPAPATVELTRGFPVRGTDIEGELLTPTGAAILTTLAARHSPPPFVCARVGLGAGTADRGALPNLLRLFVGETVEPLAADTVWVLETNLDDMSPEHVAYVFQRLLEAGALDAYAAPLQMKKGRPGILLSVIAEDSARAGLERILFAETTTFGVRRYRAERTKLPRETHTVETPHGRVRVKVGLLDGSPCTAAPEYEDCRRIAAEFGIPLREVYRQALRAWEARGSS